MAAVRTRRTEAGRLRELISGVRPKLVKAPQPEWIEPMLATLVDKPFSREGWIFEPKFDGIRCLVFRRGGTIRLLSRNQNILNEKYPELVRAFKLQPTMSFIVDGEIVAYEGSVTRFSRLQQRMQSNPSEALQKSIPVYFCAFDVLYLKEFDVRQVPLQLRKEMLRSGFQFNDPLRHTEHRETNGEDYYHEACEGGMEGLVAKKADSAYLSRRSPAWLKFKCVNDQEFVIGGYTDPQGHRRGFGALLLGYYRRGKLVFAGKVGTGYDAATLRSLAKQLAAMETQECPFADPGTAGRSAHWVKPKLVAQVGFTEWTSDGKLRHPRFLGLRDDKEPAKVVRENVP